MKLAEYVTDGAPTSLWAHTPCQGSVQAETLGQHSEWALQFFEKLCEENGLATAIHRAVDALTVDGSPLTAPVRRRLTEWFRQAVYLHDLGKINPVFQKKRMNNPYLDKLDKLPGDASHALLSALLFLDIGLAELADNDFFQASELEQSFMKHVLHVFAYVISRHHTCLTNVEEIDGDYTVFEGQLKRLQDAIHKRPAYIHYYRHKERLMNRDIAAAIGQSHNERFADMHVPFPFYVLTKLLYSTLTACDFYATHSFDTGVRPRFHYFGPGKELAPVLEAFRNTAICRGIQKFRDDPGQAELEPINRLRAALFLETQQELVSNLDQHIYYLEAPTGSGKTYMSINLGLTLLNSQLGMNKLVYVFPFNTLVEQTKQTLNDIFAEKLSGDYRMAVINSVTPIVSEAEQAAAQATNNDRGDVELDFKAELLQRQMLQYPVTLTSHVNFFNYLFGLGRESNLAFTHLCNSVVILDEIQSYRNAIWKEMIHFLHHFAKLLNMKIIIMSATLPNLNFLLEEESRTCLLVKNRDHYFQSPLFRDRVALHFELLQRGEMTEELLLNEVTNKLAERQQQGKSTRLFIEFITKRSARNFYRLLLNAKIGVPVVELTGDDSNLLRKKLIKQLGKDKKGEFFLKDVIVVATQVIEAGVDIDMDIGYKDISLLDSEEQFLGRINRSCQRGDCHAYFFNLVKATQVYRNDERTACGLQTEEYRQVLADKDFGRFYQVVMDRIAVNRKKANSDNWAYFTSAVQQLRFTDVEQTMRLIEGRCHSLFIAHTVEYQDEAGCPQQLSGSQVWAEFKELLSDLKLDYAKRMVRLSQVKQKMAYFTFSYGREDAAQTPQIYDEKIGMLYYVAQGECFMEADALTGAKKFNREAYLQAEGAQLL